MTQRTSPPGPRRTSTRATNTVSITDPVTDRWVTASRWSSPLEEKKGNKGGTFDPASRSGLLNLPGWARVPSTVGKYRMKPSSHNTLPVSRRT